jgi:type I restriction enzyme S subunit
LRYCPIPRGKEVHFALKPGDLLLNWRSGSAEHVGKTALFSEVGLYTCASFILRIRSFEGVSNNRYLRHVLNFMRAEGVFSGQSRMQINHKLNATEFSAFPIRVPRSIQEQEIIADKLDAVEAFSNQVRNEISQKLDEVLDLRESILRKAFAGEL